MSKFYQSCMTDSERKAAALFRKTERENKVRASTRCLTCSADPGQACEGNQSGVTVDMTWSHRLRYDSFRLKEKAAKRAEDAFHLRLRNI